MTMKIGTLEVDINGDTTGLKTAEAQTARSTTKIEKDLLKTGKAANVTTKRFKGVGRSAGQAGIQVQQMVGQLQGGTSAFVAISQQAADFGFVLGAPMIGVIVSLSAVLAGVLWEALGNSSEAMERAATSADDLTKEYLKMIGAASSLKMLTLSEEMLADAEAIKLAEAELKKLQDRKEATIASGAVLAPGLIEGFDKDIREADHKLQIFYDRQAFRQTELNRLFGQGMEGVTGPQQTDAPGGAGATGGSTFDQLMQEEIASLQLRAQLFSDSNLAIEAELLRFELAALNAVQDGNLSIEEAEQGLADKRVELREAANDKITKSDEAAAKKQASQRRAADSAALNGMAQLGNNLNSAIEASGKEGTAIAKGIFLAQKAIQIAQILAATEVAAAQAAAVAALGGPVGFFATQGAIRATGYASAGIVAGLSVGEAFENGGIVGGGSFTGDNINARVNSGEMILNRTQQSKLFSMANGGNSGGASIPSVTIINEPGVFTETQSVTMDEVVMVARRESKRAEDKINTSLATGRGQSANSVRQGFNMNRNIK
jgi:hypothetical protein